MEGIGEQKPVALEETFRELDLRLRQLKDEVSELRVNAEEYMPYRRESILVERLASTLSDLTESLREARRAGLGAQKALAACRQELAEVMDKRGTEVRTIVEDLGWKTSGNDPKGFAGELTRSFDLREVEGHVEASWNPRSYSVQSDLSGGVTGAQASLYARAKNALDQTLPLLDGLYSLSPDADPEDCEALREIVRSEMAELIEEFGAVGGPRVQRVNECFRVLLGRDPADSGPVAFNPDQIGGTLGRLRETYGIHFGGNAAINSIEDEQNTTNFLVICDYLTAMLQSWLGNRACFVRRGGS